MKSILKTVILGAVIVAVSVLSTDADAQSSKPGSSSKPSSSGSSKPSSSSGSGSSKPKFSAPPSSSPKAPPSTSDGGSKPKFSAPGLPHGSDKDKDSHKPKFSSPTEPTGSNKPSGHVGERSAKAQAAKEARSERKFVESKKATAPPKPKYTSPDGKEVHVRTGSKDVEYIRSLPSSSIKPEVRHQNISVHVTHHYHHPYTYYTSQPVVYVGGGYSSAFWWMMMEWDAERRARWLYHNRYNIEADAYNRGVRDAQVAAYINKMEAERAARNGGYVDAEFKKDPSLMYTDDYVQAAYNPTVVHHEPVSGAAVLRGFLWVMGAALGVGVLCLVVYLVFYHRW